MSEQQTTPAEETSQEVQEAQKVELATPGEVQKFKKEALMEAKAKAKNVYTNANNTSLFNSEINTLISKTILNGKDSLSLDEIHGAIVPLCAYSKVDDNGKERKQFVAPLIRMEVAKLILSNLKQNGFKVTKDRLHL